MKLFSEVKGIVLKIFLNSVKNNWVFSYER